VEEQLHNEPEAFNPDFREGLGEKLSEEYGKFCDENPNATQQERKDKHAQLRKELTPQYPSLKELKNPTILTMNTYKGV
jgi:hypothetical protein